MQIYLHTKDRPNDDWTNVEYAVKQVPAVGDYIVATLSSEWYLITAVVHTVFPNADYVAEVYAVLTSKVAAMSKAGKLPD